MPCLQTHVPSQLLRSILSKSATARCQCPTSLRPSGSASAKALMAAEKLKMSGSNLRQGPMVGFLRQNALNCLFQMLDVFADLPNHHLMHGGKEIETINQCGIRSALQGANPASR